MTGGTTRAPARAPERASQPSGPRALVRTRYAILPGTGGSVVVHHLHHLHHLLHELRPAARHPSGGS